MPPASGVGHSTSSRSLHSLFRRNDKSLADDAAPEAPPQVDPPEDADRIDLEIEKYRIIDTLNPKVYNSEEIDSVGERLNTINEKFRQWASSKNPDPQLAATARYRSNSRRTADTLLDGATALLSVSGRANVKSETGRNKKTKGAAVVLKAGAAVASAIPVPGVSVAFKAAGAALSLYSKKYYFDNINNAITRIFEKDEKGPFSEGLSLALALMKMGTLGNREQGIIEQGVMTPRDNKGKKKLSKDEMGIEEEREEERASAGKDTANAILALVSGEIFPEHEILDMTTKRKLEVTLRHFSHVENIDFDEGMVACRPPAYQEMADVQKGIRKSISLGRINQNPGGEAIPALAPAGGYGPEETQAIPDVRAEAVAAYQRVLEKIDQQNEANAIHKDLLKKAKKIDGFWHPLDKIKADNAANEALERSIRKEKERKKAEATYERLLNKAYGEHPQDTTPALGIGTMPSGSGSTHTPTYAQPVAPANQPSGANRTGWNIQYANTQGLTYSQTPLQSSSTHVQAGPSNQVPLRMSTGHHLEESPWQVAPAPAPRENLVYHEPESDEELDPTPSTRRRNRRDEVARPSGSKPAPGTGRLSRRDDDMNQTQLEERRFRNCGGWRRGF